MSPGREEEEPEGEEPLNLAPCVYVEMKKKILRHCQQWSGHCYLLRRWILVIVGHLPLFLLQRREVHT